MKELIAVGTTEIQGRQIQTVNARDLHAFLESGKQFSDWIKDRINKYDFKKGNDFIVLHQTVKNLDGGRPAQEYHLSLDMAKELSMVERNEKGKQARQYFIECERVALSGGTTEKAMLDALNNPETMRGLLLAYTEKVIALEDKVERDSNKVLFHDVVMSSQKVYSLSEAAKLLSQNMNEKIGRNKLAHLLRAKGYLMQRTNEPYQQWVNSGIMIYEQKVVGGKFYKKTVGQTFITPRGLEYFANRIGKVLVKGGVIENPMAV